MPASDKIKKTAAKEPPSLTCGLVMPISTLGECSEQHWQDVKAIHTEAIESAGFKSNLVSDADDTGIIQKRIIQNLYENPIVVCDVSGKNPNVMFELGLRLAFDKPTVIVKDDATTYSFDTASIEHLEYPQDLRFNKIMEFKESLKEKVKGTHKKATGDPSYTTFLKHFGTFRVAELQTEVASKEDFIIDELRELKRMVLRVDRKESHDPLLRHLRKRKVPPPVVVAEMRSAVRAAMPHCRSDERVLSFSAVKRELDDYLARNSTVARFFNSRTEFDECLDLELRCWFAHKGIQALP